MKSKYLFFAMAAATMAACSNEDFVQNSSSIGSDNLGKLIEAPVLGVGVSLGGETRAFGNDGWEWTPTTTTGGNGSAQVTAVESIGLCWTGVNNNKDGYAGPAKETGDMVYTNVKFDHVGWLYTGEKSPDLHCGELTNGEFHNWRELTPKAKYESSKWVATGAGVLDYQRGMFKSDNSTIYEGEYIVYFPYNDSFWNAPVTAEQERIMTLGLDASNHVANTYQLVSENAFNVGYKSSINGGDEACDFSTKILTSGVKFTLSGAAEIKEIVLLSKGQKAFITRQELSAKGLKKYANSQNYSFKSLAEIYLGDSEYTSSTLVVKTNNKSKNLLIEDGCEAQFYVPFLPNKDGIDELHVLFVNNDGKVAEVTKDSWKELEFNPSVFNAITLHFDGDKVYDTNNKLVGTFTDVNYAYDEESFIAAFNKARTNATNSTPAPRTIKLLDDITLTKQVDSYFTASTNYVLVNSDEDLNGEKNVLTLGGIEEKNVDYLFRNAEFDADIVNVPQGCCNKGKATLTLVDFTTTANTNLTLYGTELTLYNRNIKFNGDVYSKFEGIDEEDENHIDRVPQIKLVALNSNPNKVIAKANFINEGIMTIPVKTKFELDGGQLTNAETSVGEEEYRASITVAGNGNAGEDGVLLMTKEAKLTNEGDIYNKGNIDNNSQPGSFVNEDYATFTDYVGSTLSGYRILNNGENAEFICEVNSLVRYQNAINVNGIRPTTTLRFVYGDDANIGNGDFIKEYTLQPNKLDGIYVPYPYDKDKLMKFESAIDKTTKSSANKLILKAAFDSEGKVIATKIGNLTVKSGLIEINHSGLTIDGNYTVDGGNNTYIANDLKITGNMELKNVNKESEALTGNVKLAEDKELAVDGNINVTRVNELIFSNGSKVTAENMTVGANQKVTFEQNNVTKLGDPDDKTTGILTNEGSITIVNAVTGSNVAAEVWCNSRQGEGSYANNSYPQYY